MAIYAIADLHLSLGCEKPMDIFEGWENHMSLLREHWERKVQRGDTVVIPGDISWGMSFEEAEKDFAFIHELPGTKLLMKGNHDYWWATRAKMERWFEEKGFSSLRIVHNDSYEAEGKVVCGTRGWFLDESEPDNEKILAREAGRLRASLQHAVAFPAELERIVFLHYPPIYHHLKMQVFIDIMKEFGVARCYYGHLHGSSIRYSFNGKYDDVRFQLISADCLQFSPLRIH